MFHRVKQHTIALDAEVWACCAKWREPLSEQDPSGACDKTVGIQQGHSVARLQQIPLGNRWGSQVKA